MQIITISKILTAQVFHKVYKLFCALYACFLFDEWKTLFSKFIRCVCMCVCFYGFNSVELMIIGDDSFDGFE